MDEQAKEIKNKVMFEINSLGGIIDFSIINNGSVKCT
jgi:hypothetical protein